MRISDWSSDVCSSDLWKKLAREHRGVTQELAAFIAGLKPGDIPGKTRAILDDALVDALGCGLYGLTTPWGRIMAEFAREQQGPAEAVLWGSGARVSAPNTVLAGGTDIPSFAFDDNRPAQTHPGPPVVARRLGRARPPPNGRA